MAQDIAGTRQRRREVCLSSWLLTQAGDCRNPAHILLALNPSLACGAVRPRGFVVGCRGWKRAMTSSIACERVSCNASEPVLKSGRDVHSVMLEVDATYDAEFVVVRKSSSKWRCQFALTAYLHES